MEYLDQLLEEATNSEITMYTAVIRLLFSFLMGVIIGIERQYRRQEAGLRTFTLICLGSTVAMLVSIWIPLSYTGLLGGDPGRIAAQVLTGIGFLGAGAIIHSHGSIHGLTTAACIWVTAVIGLAVGAGMYIPAFITTLLTVSVLISLERLEKRMFLDGVNKILTIDCSTSEPDLRLIRQTLVSQKVYIVTTSYEHDYLENKSTLTYKVNVKAISSYKDIFAAIHDLGYITHIKIQA
ncbi:MAG: MgtC/SapB family protein [Tannerella sp.]|jgi:putative Mg2+ transporter-C (MgtC) family protein|nr:MgtC/SapB family protein [Tannerella sp.]